MPTHKVSDQVEDGTSTQRTPNLRRKRHIPFANCRISMRNGMLRNEYVHYRYLFNEVKIKQGAFAIAITTNKR